MEEQLLAWGIPPALVVIIIAMLPIFELRGALPVGIGVLHMPWPEALGLSLLGNLLPIPFVLLFLEAGTRFLCRFAFFRRFFNWLFERTRKRSDVIQKYKRIGLAIFVGIPLPLTGAWTGAVAAVLLGIPFWHALVAIAAGVLMAGVIVTALTLLGWWGAIIAGAALGALAVASLWRMKDSSKA